MPSYLGRVKSLVHSPAITALHSTISSLTLPFMHLTMSLNNIWFHNSTFIWHFNLWVTPYCSRHYLILHCLQEPGVLFRWNTGHSLERAGKSLQLKLTIRENTLVNSYKISSVTRQSEVTQSPCIWENNCTVFRPGHITEYGSVHKVNAQLWEHCFQH